MTVMIKTEGMTKRMIVKCRVWAALLCCLFSACAPAVEPGQQVTVFVRSERFGALNFSDIEKNALLSEALLSRGLKHMRKTVAFRVLSGDAALISAVAVYQVDAQQRPPKLKAGYEFQFLIGQAQEVRLRNDETGLEAIVSLGL